MFPELLLDLAREVRLPRQLLLIPQAGTSMGERQFRRIQLALDFEARAAEFKLRAQVEGWDVERLVREMY